MGTRAQCKAQEKKKKKQLLHMLMRKTSGKEGNNDAGEENCWSHVP